MASSLPPPGASRPRPPLAPPALGAADDLPAPAATDEPEDPGPAPVAVAADLSPPRPGTAWPSLEEARRERSFRRQRWILALGYLAVAVAIGTVAYSAWLVSSPPAWVTWVAVTIVPAALTVLAALAGVRWAPSLAVLAAAWYVVVGLVTLVLQPPVGLPLLVCGLVAVAVTMAARGSAAIVPAAADEAQDDGDPPVANTAG